MSSIWISTFPQLSKTSSICACSANGSPRSSRSSSRMSRRSLRLRVTAPRSAWATRTERMKRVMMAEVDETPERRYSMGRAIVDIWGRSMVGFCFF